MWKEIWNLISSQEDLLTEAYREAVIMLKLDKKMFTMVGVVLAEETTDSMLDELREHDQELNELQQTIRRKTFEHLAVSKGRDLLSGLVLTSIVIDLERIGDYTKNMAELVDMFPGRLDPGDDSSLLEELRGMTNQLFDMTLRALKDQHENSARACMDQYHRLSGRCDSNMERIIAGAKSDKAVGKSDLAIVLLLRYFKRVGAHLKNIASSTVAPFPMIGYHLDGSDLD